jgi:hypothetical protein
MRKSKLVLLLLAAATAVGAGLHAPRVLSAQEVRCWDVVCTVDIKGNMSCVEKPKPCPVEIT